MQLVRELCMQTISLLKIYLLLSYWEVHPLALHRTNVDEPSAVSPGVS